MKKLFLLALLVVITAGCDKKQADGTYMPHPGAYRIYVIDSCEYIGTLDGGTANFLAKKGNCRFCRERDEQLIRRIVREEVDSILTEIFD